MLERDGELARLRTLIEAAAAGNGAAATVVGPAGIGKTSLLAAAREVAADASVPCLSARGGELERDFSYGVVRQLFELPLRELSSAERRSILEGAAAFAAPVVGVQILGGDQPADPFAVLHGLYWLTANLTQRSPLTLIIDDLHWADAASLRFIDYLQRRLEDLPLLVVTAARPSIDAGQAEWVHEVTMQPFVERLVPAPLSRDAVKEIVRSSPNDAPEAPFVDACHEATAGNPFLCALLASTLAEEGVRGLAAEAPRVIELAGRALSTVVLRRLGRVPDSAISLARAVAILGTDTELRHAAVLAELNQRDAATATDLLAAQEILRVEHTIDFVHPLVRTAVRDGIPDAERTLLHARAARLLAAEGVRPERTAMHLLAVEPASESWIVETLRTAARNVASRGDPATAASYLKRALREPPADADRVTLLHELGAAEIHAGDAGSAAEHLSEAHQLARSALERADIARDLSLALTTPGHFDRAVTVLQEAIVEVADLDRDLSLLLRAELQQSAMMKPSLYATVKDLLERTETGLSGDTPGERAMLAVFANEGLLRTAGAGPVREWARRALERGLLDDRTSYSALWLHAAFSLIFADAFSEADAAVARAIAAARRRGSAIGSSHAHTVSSILHLRRGAIHDAEDDARTAIQLGPEGGFRLSFIALEALIESLVERGELEAADAVLDARGIPPTIPERFHDNHVLHARGWLRLAQGRIQEASADFEELGRRGANGWRPWNPAVFPYRSGLALTLLRTGDRAQARDLAEEELEASRAWGTPRAIGISLRTLALVEGGTRGVDLLRTSVSTLEGSGARLEYARSLVGLGAALRRGKKRAEAREPLAAGMELAHRCGAEALVKRAREELVTAGARPRRTTRSGVDALTPAERRVAAMAVEGMTNREIAQALFVTLRTVEVHLTHAYQKLGISSRRELAPTLSGFGVTTPALNRPDPG